MKCVVYRIFYTTQRNRYSASRTLDGDSSNDRFSRGISNRQRVWRSVRRSDTFDMFSPSVVRCSDRFESLWTTRVMAIVACNVINKISPVDSAIRGQRTIRTIRAQRSSHGTRRRNINSSVQRDRVVNIISGIKSRRRCARNTTPSGVIGMVPRPTSRARGTYVS